MNLPDLGVLALVGGVADALPIDASAHSLLASRLLGWRAGPIAAALDLGTVLALMAYLWREMTLIGAGLWKLRKARIEAGTRLLAKMLLAALPLALAQSDLGGFTAPAAADLLWVGVITLAGAVILLLADRLSLTVKRIEHIGFGTSLAVGLAQLLSLVTGVGRVAAALTMARLFGMERQDAYRFSLLVSVPYLWLRASSEFLANRQAGQILALSDLLAAGLTFLLVLAALPLAFSLIRRFSLLPFALYRVIFAMILIGLGLL